MADKANDKEKKTYKTDAPPPQAGGKIGILTWVIMLSIIVVLSGSGFVLGHLLAGSSSETAPAASESAPPAQTPGNPSASTSVPSVAGLWYYNDLESVVVNPAEPGATRFIRVGLILEMMKAADQEKIKVLIDSKKPLLVNYLNLYFKSLTLAEMENERDLNRILSQLCDAFNEILSPAAAPLIKKILIREFNIQ